MMKAGWMRYVRRIVVGMYKNFESGSIEIFIDKAVNPELEIFVNANITHYPLRDYSSMWNTMANEVKLRFCYRKNLELAKENNIKSISFPLISTGGFGYPKEEGMCIAVDKINAFLLGNDMEIYLIVFDARATQLGEKIYPDLEAYIDHNYVKDKREEEYGAFLSNAELVERRLMRQDERNMPSPTIGAAPTSAHPSFSQSIFKKSSKAEELSEQEILEECDAAFDFEEQHESKVEE